MSLTLTDEQKEKLRKLDEEMQKKKEFEEKNRGRKEASSKATGVPIDIVDMDVIKVGTLLGLIKKRTVREGKEAGSTSTLMDLFLGGDDNKIDKTQIPSHYRNAPHHVDEPTKMQYHQDHVQKQSEVYSQLTSSTIKEALTQIRTHVSINLEQWSVDHFVTTTKETMDVILEELLDEDDEELWTMLSGIRQTLLGPLNICDYKRILTNQILEMRGRGKHHRKIINHLSTIEKRLVLYPGCLQAQTPPFTVNDEMQLKRELLFRNYTGDPELKPFVMETISRQCCTPSLLCLPIDVVINLSLLNPYMNNPIGYLKMDQSPDPDPWSFFVLDKINKDGVRLWVLDNRLVTFSQILSDSLARYLVNIFRIFYHECFKTNMFIKDFLGPSDSSRRKGSPGDVKPRSLHHDVFNTLIKSLAFVTCGERFHTFIKTLVMHKSFLIPTDHDFFNQLRDGGDAPEPQPNTFHLILPSLFDGPILPSVDALSAFDQTVFSGF